MGIFFLLVIIAILITMYYEIKRYHEVLNFIPNFNKEIRLLKNHYIEDSEIAALRTTFLLPYNYFSNQPKIPKVKEFIYMYVNLESLSKKWNEDFLKREEYREEYTSNFNKAHEFIKLINEYKNTYFTTKMRDSLLQDYNYAYNYFTSSYLRELNLVASTDFIETYSNLYKLISSWNLEFVQNKMKILNNFFENIDGKVLDYQQKNAIITDDMNNLIIAGVGTGKTLTLASKIKYLVECEKINPSDILLLTFTKKSSKKLNKLVKDNFKTPINAITFDELCLKILNNTGPSNLIDNAKEIISDYFKKYILNDFDTLKNILDFYLYYLDIPPYVESYEIIGKYIKEQNKKGFETLKSKYEKDSQTLNNSDDKQTHKNEIVKNIEELFIANFLFMNGILYQYKPKYPHNSDNTQKVYNPNFYLPEYNIYLEHSGIIEDEKKPWLNEIEEKKYLKDMRWKVEYNKKHGTRIIQTYSIRTNEYNLVNELKSILEMNNVSLSAINYENIYRKIIADEENHFKEFENLIYNFIQLYKSNEYTTSKLNSLKKSKDNTYITRRNNAFLDIIKPILIHYENELIKQNKFDINDAIIQAATLVEKSNSTFNYKYILVDEYENISFAKNKLLKAIVNKSKAKIVCACDDNQAIKQTTGSDLNLLNNFEDFFGETTILRLEKTYRVSQELLDITNEFIKNNPIQINKEIVSEKEEKDPIIIMNYFKDEKLSLDKAIKDIYLSYGEEAQILLIGKTYKDIRQFEDENLKYNSDTNKVFYKPYPNMDITFLTVPFSKGEEADNVIILNLKNELSGFPNRISDDPVLSILLKNSSYHPFEDERRLFYVALTRTKNKNYLIAPYKDYSLFLEELKNISNLTSFMNKSEQNDLYSDKEKRL